MPLIILGAPSLQWYLDLVGHKTSHIKATPPNGSTGLIQLAPRTFSLHFILVFLYCFLVKYSKFRLTKLENSVRISWQSNDNLEQL